MKFRSDEDGYITALRFYKQANNTGTPRRPPLVGHGPAARDGALHRTRPPRAGRRSSSRTRWRSPRTPPTSPRTTRPRGCYALQPGLLQPGRGPPAAARAERDARRRQRRLPLRRERLPGPDLQRDQLLGRRDLRPHDPARTRAARRSPTSRRRAARPTSRPPPTVTATFDEPLAPATVTGATFTLRDENGTLVPADVSYDAQTRVAKLKPHVAARLRHETYTARAQGRRRRRDRRGGQPAGRRHDLVLHDRRRSRPAEGPGGPIQVDHGPGRPVRPLLRGDPARRGPQRVRRDRRPGHRAEARRPRRGAAGLGRGQRRRGWRCSPTGCRPAAT